MQSVAEYQQLQAQYRADAQFMESLDQYAKNNPRIVADTLKYYAGKWNHEGQVCTTPEMALAAYCMEFNIPQDTRRTQNVQQAAERAQRAEAHAAYLNAYNAWVAECQRVKKVCKDAAAQRRSDSQLARQRRDAAIEDAKRAREEAVEKAAAEYKRQCTAAWTTCDEQETAIERQYQDTVDANPTPLPPVRS